METGALSVTRFIFPSADAERIDGLAKTDVNTAVFWVANEIELIQSQ